MEKGINHILQKTGFIEQRIKINKTYKNFFRFKDWNKLTINLNFHRDSIEYYTPEFIDHQHMIKL